MIVETPQSDHLMFKAGYVLSWSISDDQMIP